MNALFGSDALLYPSLGPAVLDVIRSAYASLLIATLVAALPHARRYFLSERWGGYAERGRWTDRLQNPVALPLILAVWLAASVALLVNRAVVPAACINVLFCRYFFIQMRWRGVLRGMGAPGFIAYWLAVAVLLLEYTRRLRARAPRPRAAAAAGRFRAHHALGRDLQALLGLPRERRHGARHGEPRVGLLVALLEPAAAAERAGSVSVTRRHGKPRSSARCSCSLPPTRFLGGLLILLSFIFIATQIRLGFLCEMVIVCTLLFAHQGSLIDLWLTTAWRPQSLAEITAAPASMNVLVGIGLWGYLLVLPLARAGLAYNLYRKKTLSPTLQRVFEAYTNLFG